MEIARFAELYQSVSDEISRIVVGQPDVVDGALVALFSGGRCVWVQIALIPLTASMSINSLR